MMKNYWKKLDIWVLLIRFKSEAFVLIRVKKELVLKKKYNLYG